MSLTCENRLTIDAEQPLLNKLHHLLLESILPKLACGSWDAVPGDYLFPATPEAAAAAAVQLAAAFPTAKLSHQYETGGAYSETLYLNGLAAITYESREAALSGICCPPTPCTTKQNRIG